MCYRYWELESGNASMTNAVFKVKFNSNAFSTQ